MRGREKVEVEYIQWCKNEALEQYSARELAGS